MMWVGEQGPEVFTSREPTNVLLVTDQTTKAELEEAMRNLTETLHRMPEHWVDRRAALHTKIDALLGEWQQATER